MTAANSRRFACAGYLYCRACANSTYYHLAELEVRLLEEIRADLSPPEIAAELGRRVR